jgi:hypothetical protein
MLEPCPQYNNTVVADGSNSLAWMQKTSAADEQQRHIV